MKKFYIRRIFAQSIILLCVVLVSSCDNKSVSGNAKEANQVNGAELSAKSSAKNEAVLGNADDTSKVKAQAVNEASAPSPQIIKKN